MEMFILLMWGEIRVVLCVGTVEVRMRSRLTVRFVHGFRKMFHFDAPSYCNSLGHTALVPNLWRGLALMVASQSCPLSWLAVMTRPRDSRPSSNYKAAKPGRIRSIQAEQILPFCSSTHIGGGL